ncbi:unnamed protein product [Gongylonema pulchrum]|uniref:EB domain-containing protein n=1 Tax=Gongylonema pulchrum TaxID=637853 RepID=A0A183DKI2_9BILA|nr:unnamed protein product [Gongylonema pulchrum]
MEQCPAGSGCFRGVCCPLVCPSGQDATGFCGPTLSVTMSCSQQILASRLAVCPDVAVNSMSQFACQFAAVVLPQLPDVTSMRFVFLAVTYLHKSATVFFGSLN